MSAIRLRQRGRGYRKNPQTSATQIHQTKDFPAPMAGWISNENIAMANPLGAVVLENFFPTERSIQARGGSQKWATVGLGTNPVYSLINYKTGTLEHLFAGCGGAIYNITSVVDEDSLPTPVITGQASDHYSGVLMTNASGSFMQFVNGTDNPQVWNGTVWEELDNTKITGGVAPETISQGFKHRSRVFYIIGGTMNAWYLATNAYKGAATLLPLGGIFKMGGSLLFGATWSQDAGDGADDRCVFVTDLGEVAVYSGGDPASWGLIGRYDLGGVPRGKNAWMSVAGDLLIITEMGIIPISQVITKDPAQLAMIAVTKNIAPDWHEQVRRRGDFPWEGTKYGNQDLGVITWPRGSGEMPPMTPVVNLKTGAWAKFTAWDALSVCIHGDQLFFGTTDGLVFKADIGAEDDGVLFTATAVWAFNDFDAPGAQKLLHKARFVYATGYPVNPLVSASVNYAVSLPAAPDAFSVDGATVGWDASIWDVSTWDDTVTSPVTGVFARWEPIGRAGFSHALQIQVTFSGTQKPDLEIVRVSATYSAGATVVAGV